MPNIYMKHEQRSETRSPVSAPLPNDLLRNTQSIVDIGLQKSQKTLLPEHLDFCRPSSCGLAGCSLRNFDHRCSAVSLISFHRGARFLVIRHVGIQPVSTTFGVLQNAAVLSLCRYCQSFLLCFAIVSTLPTTRFFKAKLFSC